MYLVIAVPEKHFYKFYIYFCNENPQKSNTAGGLFKTLRQERNIVVGSLVFDRAVFVSPQNSY